MKTEPGSSQFYIKQLDDTSLHSYKACWIKYPTDREQKHGMIAYHFLCISYTLYQHDYKQCINTLFSKLFIVIPTYAQISTVNLC